MAAIIGREPIYQDPIPAVNLPKVRRTPPFRFTHHPTQWDVVELPDGELGWFPVLGKQQLDFGVNGVDEKGKDLHSRDWHTKNGIQILNVPYREYMMEIDTISGVSMREKWEQIHVAGGKQLIEYDTEGFQNWVLSLMERGILDKEPEAPVVNIILADWRKKLDRASGEYSKKPYPGLEIRMESLKKKIQFVENRYGRTAGTKAKVRKNEGKPGQTRGEAA